MNKLTLTTMLASAGIVAGCAGQPDQPVNVLDRPEVVTVEQKAGKLVYWVKPGPRKNLSKSVFGTPNNPERYDVEQYIAQTDLGPIKQLLRDMPTLVAAPLEARKTNASGTAYTAFARPTAFSNQAQPLSMQTGKNGSFRARMVNNVETDQPGGPFAAADELDFETVFHDPDGNRYRIDMKTLIQPPIPGYETGGGVVVDTDLHGDTGTGTPLMPREYTHAAFWGFGDLYVNGEKQGTWLTHLMTTEVVRKGDYSLAIDEELPLSADKRPIASQPHHTHVIMMPIEPYKPMPVLGALGMGPTAPRFAPVKTAYQLPNGMTQPFIHMMYEQDSITEAKNVSLNFLRNDEPGAN
jgi:hypothetical protein